MNELRFRQVHLDFHTSPLIDNVGADFDARRFADTLEKAAVDSITCFARCHHGLLYYESRNFPELIHPNLRHRGLLESQIEACRERGIRVPVYTTVRWDKLQADAHPEWLVRRADGAPQNHSCYEAGFYNALCINTPYRDFLKAQVADMFESLPAVDGLFFDIVTDLECSCEYCREGMIREGFEPHLESCRRAYGKRITNQFKYWMTRIVRSCSADCSIFYNCRAVQQHSKGAYSHIEIESLPSGAWGYDHFAFEARYVRNLGCDILGQTGKFHTAWGDFHSFKNREALEYECFRMLALNAKCMVGDQLEPNGELSEPVYSLIGDVFRRIRSREPWCRSAKPLCDTAVLDPREYFEPCRFDSSAALLGAMKILEQSGVQFDIIDSRMDFSRFRLLVLPDEIPVQGDLSQKLTSFIDNGGALILSYKSGFQEDYEPGFSAMPVTRDSHQRVDIFGEEMHGRFDARRNAFANYLLPAGEIGMGLPNTEHVMYMRNLDVTPRPRAEILANAAAPEFYRDYRHFCSHRQAPSSGRIEGPAVVRLGRVIYFAHNIFTQYERRSPRWVKRLFLNAMHMLVRPMLIHDGPTTLLTAVNRREEAGQDVLHLLHYIPRRSCAEMDIIEDVIPLHDVRIDLDVGHPVKSVRLVPRGYCRGFFQEGG